MRDPITKIPYNPPPIEWVGWNCLSCEQRGHKDKELSEGYRGEIPPGVRLRGRPYQPPAPDDESTDA